MKLLHDLHLAYCTNIHRGETWPETWAALKQFTLAVREQVCPKEFYAIGLRLSAGAAQELSEARALLEFQRWLQQNNCYVFTINGFPYGQFHGVRVKEKVYLPDWTSADRVNYTNLLFNLLSRLVPEGMQGSVSTVPLSFKEFGRTDAEARQMRDNVFACVEHVDRVCQATGKHFHLGLEPEPLCVLETTEETVRFFEKIRSEHRWDERLVRLLGVNYDCCHMAVEFEDAPRSINRLREAGIKISKIHLSSALRLVPTDTALSALRQFADDTYLHQVVVKDEEGALTRFRDVDDALKSETRGVEWRVHFHIPLHHAATSLFGNTLDHLRGVLSWLRADPGLCSHLEMETYTWEVMPPGLKSRSVVEQLTAEYEWCRTELRERGLAP